MILHRCKIKLGRFFKQGIIEMTNKTELNEIASKTLGSENSYAVFTDKYDTSLLNLMPRDLARKDWGIDGSEMSGYDVWNCYEATFLLDSGQPVAGTLKMVFPISNKDVVESKSMKLFLNSFDMCKMGKTFKEAISNYENAVRAAFSAKGLICNVRFYSVHILESTSLRNNQYPHPLRMFSLLDIDEKVEFDDYTASKKHLEGRANLNSRHLVYTNILRSRCRHTKQKDSGSAFMIFCGDYKPSSLLQEIVSLREVNEFHEFCAEKLYVSLSEKLADVGVALLYSRRGGIDIMPIRFSSNSQHAAASINTFQPLYSTQNFVPQIFGQ